MLHFQEETLRISEALCWVGSVVVGFGAFGAPRFSVQRLGSAFGRTDFSRILFLGRRIFSRENVWAAGFFRDFLARFFLLIFLGEEVPRKILQENPQRNPPKFTQQKSPTCFCRGARPTEVLKYFFKRVVRLLDGKSGRSKKSEIQPRRI